MRSLPVLSAGIGVTLLGAAVLVLTLGSNDPTIARVDFGSTRTALQPAYDARLAPVDEADIKEFIIPITHETIEVGVPKQFATMAH